MRVSVATTLLSPRQDCESRRPVVPLLLLPLLPVALPLLLLPLPPVVLAAQVADTVVGLVVGRAEEITWKGADQRREGEGN